MWRCPECGKYNSGEYCEKCGKRYAAVSESIKNPSLNRWTINDLAIIVLTITGAIILLTTSLVKIPYLEEYIKLNNLAFGNWNDYISLSTIFQYFEKAGWILLLMKVAAVALYAVITVSLVETAKKLTSISQVLRWITLGIGLLLVITMLWIKAKINQDLIASMIAGNLKYGYGGVLLGLLLLGAAVFLSFRKGFLDIKVYELGASTYVPPKEDAVPRAEFKSDATRPTSLFETPIPTLKREHNSAETSGVRKSEGFYDTPVKSPERDSEYVPSFADTDRTVTPGKLKSTLRTHASQPFENEEAASYFKRPKDL